MSDRALGVYSPAEFSPVLYRAFGSYSRWLISRRFHAAWVRGNAAEASRGAMVVMQHVSWWDILALAMLTTQRWPPARIHVMMDAKNLAKFPLFARFGAFGVDLASPDGRAAAVRHSVALARTAGQRVVIFPQGRQRPMDRRPLACFKGSARIAAESSVTVVPVAMRYEFLEDEHPDMFLSHGEPTTVSAEALASSNDPIEAMLTREADRLRDDVYARGCEGFERMVRGRGDRDPRGE